MEQQALPTLGKVILSWLHLSAAVVWLGAVFSGGVVARRAARRERQTVRDRIVASFYGAFSPFAWGALGVLVLTGIVRAQSHLPGGAKDLILTDWGNLLLLKLVVATLLMAAGAYTTYGLVPRLDSSRYLKESTHKGASPAALRQQLERRLVWTSRVAIFLALLLLFIVTLL